MNRAPKSTAAFDELIAALQEIRDGYVLTCQCHPISDKVVVSYDER